VSFTYIKPATEAINLKLAKKFAKVVRIPKIPPQTTSFGETLYFWEMETTAAEVVGVNFRHSTGFSKSQDKIEAILELPPSGDASIFAKVLPAIVADSQSLSASQDIEKANFDANKEAGYLSIRLSVKPETKQTTRIIWNFDKNYFLEDISDEYAKLQRIPEPVLKNLYLFQKLIIDLSGV